ncbi:SDR family NAD(P)-dependent oxidoreductase [Gramella sp. BOM4]|nr:SDR family NAD(P)-dependent oxidoreductase [Christiangramia bathymodioli]
MTKFKNSTLLITGGASGIGLLMALKSLEQGAKNLVLLDRDEKALHSAKGKLTTEEDRLLCLPVDISREDEVEEAIQKIIEKGWEVDILINNAGVVTGKDFLEHTATDIERDMQVNSIAPMKLCLKLLPGMLKRGRGHIVNISSAASMLSNPGMSVYCASKWAMTGWSDSLRLEMERKKTGVRVLTVTPYYIDTGMFEGVRSPFIPILTPEKAVKKIMKAVEHGRIILRMPGIVYILPFLKGILPKRWLDFIVGKVFGIHHSMDHFKGRQNEQA